MKLYALCSLLYALPNPQSAIRNPKLHLSRFSHNTKEALLQMGVIAQLFAAARESDSAFLDEVGSGGYTQDPAHMLAGQKKGTSVATYLPQGITESIDIPRGQTQKWIIEHE